MGNVDDKPKYGERLRAVLDFIFGFKNKRGQILDYWIDYAPEFNIASGEFYSAVEQKLAAQRIPGLTVARQEFSEGGLMSEQRIYLHLMRERLAIDACAAPFGNKIYFFSCRIVHVPALVRLWHILAALVFFNVTGWLLVVPLGLPFATVAEVALLFALVGVLRNAGSSLLMILTDCCLKFRLSPLSMKICSGWKRIIVPTPGRSMSNCFHNSSTTQRKKYARPKA
jgi:hypothetical protein